MSNTRTNTDRYLCGIEADGKLAASYILYSGKEDEISGLTDKIHSIDSALTAVKLDSETYNQLIGNRGKEYRYKNGAAVEYIPPEPTAEELADRQAQQEAYEAQNTLNAIQTKATRMMLAGGDIAAAQSDYQTALMSISDEAALKMPDYFPTWDGNGHQYAAGDRVMYDGTLYKVLQAHTSQPQWVPGATGTDSLYTHVTIDSETGYDVWRRPTGAHDAYGNACIGNNIKVYDTHNCMIHTTQEKKVVVQGLDGYIVAEKDDTLLICKLSEEQRIKQFSE